MFQFREVGKELPQRKERLLCFQGEIKHFGSDICEIGACCFHTLSNFILLNLKFGFWEMVKGTRSFGPVSPLDYSWLWLAGHIFFRSVSPVSHTEGLGTRILDNLVLRLSINRFYYFHSRNGWGKTIWVSTFPESWVLSSDTVLLGC